MAMCSLGPLPEHGLRALRIPGQRLARYDARLRHRDFSIGAERNNVTVELFLKNAFDARGEVNRYTPCRLDLRRRPIPARRRRCTLVPIQPLTGGAQGAQRF